MDRLTKWNDGAARYNDSEGRLIYNADIMEKLAMYEDLEEQGLLIKLPCPKDTPIWYIRYCTAPSCKRCGFTCSDNSCYKQYKARIFKDKFSLFYLNAFGESVFLTKEEAEKRLAELEGGVSNE